MLSKHKRILLKHNIDVRYVGPNAARIPQFSFLFSDTGRAMSSRLLPANKYYIMFR